LGGCVAQCVKQTACNTFAPRRPGETSATGEPYPFDYDTISDVILHLRYTARDGGDELPRAAVGNLQVMIKAGEARGNVRLFSIRHEFPTEWPRFHGQKPGDGERFSLKLKFKPEHYPYWTQGLLRKATSLEILVRSALDTKVEDIKLFETADRDDQEAVCTLKQSERTGKLWTGLLKDDLLATSDGELTLFSDEHSLSDIWIAVRWSGD
jgi:hypothetical protein